MSVALGTNLYAALAIVLFLAMGAFALQMRRKDFMQREHELTEAIALLEIHTEELRKLDDVRMPRSLLLLACDLSRVLHDPQVLSLTVRVMIERKIAPVQITPEKQVALDQIHRDFALLQEQHPELAASFSKALFTCIVSFEKRHPECAGQFSIGLSQVVSSPVQSAQRIVRAAGGRSDWDLGPPGAIPA